MGTRLNFDTRCVYSLVPVIYDRLLSKCIVRNTGDKSNSSAGPYRSHSLVRAFSTGIRDEIPSRERFSGTRERIGADHEVQVETSNHENRHIITHFIEVNRFTLQL